jgi:hypothetical protein
MVSGDTFAAAANFRTPKPSAALAIRHCTGCIRYLVTKANCKGVNNYWQCLALGFPNSAGLHELRNTTARYAATHDRNDFDRFHHRHRVFRNGVWVWVYGPSYAYNDCWWLRRQALITGSPYWWSRYNYCVGYY